VWRTISIIDSIGFVDASVLASLAVIPRRISVSIDIQRRRQILVEHQQPRRRRHRRTPRLVQALKLTKEGVLQHEQRASGNAHALRLTRRHRGAGRAEHVDP
jgi:hypothetical protein